MLALAHAMAQAVGGKYGFPHGTLNGILLPPALRYNTRYAPAAVRAFGEAVGGDPIARVEELTALGGVTRLSRARRPGGGHPRARGLCRAARRQPGESTPGHAG